MNERPRKRMAAFLLRPLYYYVKRLAHKDLYKKTGIIMRVLSDLEQRARIADLAAEAAGKRYELLQNEATRPYALAAEKAELKKHHVLNDDQDRPTFDHD